MRQRFFWFVGLLGLAAIGSIVTLSLTVGQDPPQRSAAPAALPPSVTSAPTLTPVLSPEKKATQTAVPDSARAATFAGAGSPQHDVNRMPPYTRQMYIAARRGVDWLQRLQNPGSGRFMFGWVPELNVPLEGDHFLHQAEATLALARAARYFGDERCLLSARQAVLSLLAETTVDPQDPSVRHTTLPSLVVNRLAAAGLILAAIHELRDPADDLLQQGEQLAAYVRKQQRADGALNLSDTAEAAAGYGDRALLYPAQAVCGLMASMRNRPAPWKLQVARNALPHLQAAWKSRPTSAGIPWLSAACAEGFLRTREAAFADVALAIGDGLCLLQYSANDNRNPKWAGGFRNLSASQSAAEVPTLASALAVECLADGCRVCRELPDVARFERYKSAVALGTQFLAQLQYTEDTTRHFAPGYRETLIGGFHPSLQNGSLAIDSHQHAVAGLILYLTYVAER